MDYRARRAEFIVVASSGGAGEDKTTLPTDSSELNRRSS
jgi:hypothetical protein